MTRFGHVVRVCWSMTVAVAIVGVGVIGAGIIVAGDAAAGQYVVSQKKRKFTPRVVAAKIGDKVVFLNDDRFAHNLFSETSGYEFDIRKQMPGDRHTITLKRKGEFEIRCAIHPRMRMKITVE